MSVLIYFPPLLLFPILSFSQFNQDFIVKHEIKKVVVASINPVSNKDTIYTIDTYNEKGLLSFHEQRGDQTRFKKTAYLYQSDYAGRIKNKTVIDANGEVSQVSLYNYFDKDGTRIEDNQIVEYRISLLTNAIDTFVLDEKSLVLHKKTPHDQTTYFYNAKRDLVRVRYTNKTDNNSSETHFILTYDNRGSLITMEGDALKTVYTYDNKGRPLTSTTYQDGKLSYFNRYSYE